MAELLRRPLLALRVLGVAVLVPLLMRLPLPRLARLLEPRRPRPADPELAAWLERRVDGVIAAGHPIVRPGCLTRGVTYFFFLRRAGVDVRLQFGMGTPEGSHEGHCWLVRDGEPYLERVDPRPIFTETYAIPQA
jgi:hypothetical protein